MAIFMGVKLILSFRFNDLAGTRSVTTPTIHVEYEQLYVFVATCSFWQTTRVRKRTKEH